MYGQISSLLGKPPGSPGTRRHGYIPIRDSTMQHVHIGYKAKIKL